MPQIEMSINIKRELSGDRRKVKRVRKLSDRHIEKIIFNFASRIANEVKRRCLWTT
jgi:hypothetical protein